MRKTDKKRNNAIRLALTDACEQALEQIPGFKWLTHYVDYQRFPQSLKVVCIFESQSALLAANTAAHDVLMRKLVTEALADIGIAVPNPGTNISLQAE